MVYLLLARSGLAANDAFANLSPAVWYALILDQSFNFDRFPSTYERPSGPVIIVVAVIEDGRVNEGSDPMSRLATCGIFEVSQDG